MYGIFIPTFGYIWLICMVNVGKYIIHGSYGYGCERHIFAVYLIYLLLTDVFFPRLRRRLITAIFCGFKVVLFFGFDGFSPQKIPPHFSQHDGS